MEPKRYTETQQEYTLFSALGAITHENTRFARIADRRRHHQHQLSTRLIRENQTIVVESLAVKHMMAHPTLSKAIADVGWGEFVSQLEYKAQWYGRTVIKIDRWYP